ncbi:MAG: nitrate/nitrite transporter NrtS [Chloroflexi bacterium]|nr:nitrate/nitrite transporter NrtS [Chloroflexota bacterium]
MTSSVSLCSRCGRDRAGRIAFMLAGRLRCPRCALLYTPMLWRSFCTAIVVGTFLTAINQGNVLLQGEVPMALYWKIPLTYVVPFCVASWGALGNASRRA